MADIADSSVAISAGSGTPIRVLTALGAASADQQVMTLADSAGNLLGTSGAPVPVGVQGTVQLASGGFTIGNVDPDVRTATGTMGALNATADGSTSTTYFPQVRLALSGTWVGTVTFQVSYDGTTWYTKALNTLTGGTTSTSTVNGIFYGDIGALFFRTIMTAYTSGTATASMSYITVGAPIQETTIASQLPTGANQIGITALPASTLVVTATGAANAIVTATLPAAGAGLFHYITNVQIERFMTAAGTGAGTAVLTSGANQSLVWNQPTDAATIGTASTVVDYRPTTPLRSTAANVNTTFITAAVAATIYRINVSYYTAA